MSLNKQKLYSFRGESIRFRRLIGVIFCVIILLVVGLQSVTLSPPKVLITGMNFYPYPIHLDTGNQQVDVAAFSPFSLYEHPTSDITLTYSHSSGEQLGTRKYVVDRESIVIDMLSSEDKVKVCFIEVALNKLFYSGTNDRAFLPSDEWYKVLNTEESTSYVYTIYSPRYLILPVNYNSSTWPTKLLTNQQLIGIFPITCDGADNPAVVKASVMFWMNYDPAKEFSLYLQVQSEIQKTPEYLVPPLY